MVFGFVLWICFGVLLPGVVARFKRVIRSARWVNGTVPRKFARKTWPKLHAAESSELVRMAGTPLPRGAQRYSYVVEPNQERWSRTRASEIVRKLKRVFGTIVT